MTTTALIDLLDGEISELEICEPGWLYAGRLTDIETGESWRFVYRSTIVTRGKSFYDRMMAWRGDAEPIGDAQIITDSEMMYGTAELMLFEP
ncbi:hypothetical protein H7J51_17925 [Mycobacterium crocinum]|uniref:Uncharacterized protein n=1 Tax=Mycolicibacterium crocinum TaxID=388459 RepID=A0ABY3TQF3_9MYCO|nr:hypothetical protein [Mycolicibacterium crocinum]MCV7217152.1 hypothetical protein [Mycolicibacterium crocinum]ULN42897.1 hypothetical protein MI149_07335 [Mycolicibacterium crocinum]